MSKRVSKAFGILFLLLELAIVPKAIDLMLNQHITELTPLKIVVISMTFGSIALCILMSYSSMSENDMYPHQTFLFDLMVFMCCIAPMTDLFTRALEEAGKPGLNMLVNTVFYLIGINIAYVLFKYEILFVGIEDNPLLQKLKRIALVLMIVDNLVTLLNVKFGYFFTITESGKYQSAPTFWLSYIAPMAIVAMTVIISKREMPAGRQQRAFLLFWIFAALSSVLQIWQETLAIQYTGYVLSLIVIYMNIQSELDTPCVKPTESESIVYEIE